MPNLAELAVKVRYPPFPAVWSTCGMTARASAGPSSAHGATFYRKESQGIRP